MSISTTQVAANDLLIVSINQNEEQKSGEIKASVEQFDSYRLTLREILGCKVIEEYVSTRFDPPLVKFHIIPSN
jgi:hypothetical protein